jgi:hypothetical protein
MLDMLRMKKYIDKKAQNFQSFILKNPSPQAEIMSMIVKATGRTLECMAIILEIIAIS